MKPHYIGFAVLAIILLGSYGALMLVTEEPEVLAMTHSTPEEYLANVDVNKLEGEIRSFCSQCHGFPEPSLFPRNVWVPELNRAIGFARDADKTENMPDERALTAWYLVNAVERTIETDPGEVDEATVFGKPTPGPRLKTSAAVTSQLLVPTGEHMTVLTTDMMSGQVRRTSLGEPDTTPQTIYTAAHPARIRACDLDPECDTEFLVSDLGIPWADDELLGKVHWIREEENEDGESHFVSTALAKQIGRVADARTADLDGDGDHDILIAEFGWYRTGSVRLLENTPDGFETHQIDDRHGAVEIEITDFDGDGRLDFLIAFGQEVESIELFTNRGGLKFEKKQIYRSELPVFGMSSLELLDCDGDGDLDVLFTSGDMYDTFHIHEHHGVYLLTNNDGEFTASRIGQQYAAMCAKHGDVDGDGDYDIVSGAFIPAGSDYGSSPSYAAIVFWEQTEPGRFEPHRLKSGDCSHTTLDLIDLDADGDLDLVTATLHDAGGVPEPGLTFWTNGLK